MLFNLIKRPDEDQRWGLKIMIMITNRQQHLRYQIYIKYSRVPSEFELPGFYCNLKFQTFQYSTLHHIPAPKPQNPAKCKSNFEYNIK